MEETEHVSGEEGGYVVALDMLFGLDRVNHGDPDEPFVWKWPKQLSGQHCEEVEKDVKLFLADGSVHLMAQHVWQSSLTLAEEMIRGRVNVKGKNVLELGAGAALPSIIARRLGATFVVTSDYPEPAIVENMEKNVRENETALNCPAVVRGFKWGESLSTLCECLPEEHPTFDLVVMADTLWLDDQHQFLLQSCRDLMDQNKGNADFRIVLTFMNHDNGKGIAESFFKAATENFGMKVVEQRRIGWKETEVNIDDPEDSDSSDPEKYGPVYFRVLADGDA